MSELFIKRPVATVIITISIIFFGVLGYLQLPVSDLPNVDFPTIEVSASLPGANPELMASSVATPLERQFSTIAGITSMTSSSKLGSSSITLQFDLSKNIDAAAQDVQSAITLATRRLPKDMPNPPTYRKVNPADSPILLLSLSSEILPLTDVNEYADTQIAQRISMIEGVAQVQIFGAQKFAVRTILDPGLMASYQIGMEEIVQAIQKSNVNTPQGTIDGPVRTEYLQANVQLLDAESYQNMIIAWRDGSPVRVSDIGKAVNGVENDKNASWFANGTTINRSIILAIMKQPGANTVKVVDDVKKLLPEFESQLPPSVHLNIVNDRSYSIRHSVADVKVTLIIAVILVVAVIFLFLKNLRATIVPSLALPVSIIGTFAGMYFLKFNIDNISLMALILAVGFVVDDAIVVLENIIRHMEEGQTPLEASVKGSTEITFTIISMTLSLVAVFIPLFLMGGIMGRIINEFAVTISIAILLSGFVSLTLTPMLCHRFLGDISSLQKKDTGLYGWLESMFEKLQNMYKTALLYVMGHKKSTITLAVATFIGAVYLFGLIPKGFMPSEDVGILNVNTEGDLGTSFSSMVQKQKKVADIISKDPNIEAFMSTVSSNNAGRMTLRLKPRNERKLSADQLIQVLRPKVAHIPGIQIYFQNPPTIRIGGRSSKALYQATLLATDTSLLYQSAGEFEKTMREIPGLLDVTSDMQLKNPQINIEIDKDKAAALGISSSAVAETLYSAYGSRQISTIFTSTNQYQVIIELEPKYHDDPSALSMLYIKSSAGVQVPLSTLCKITRGNGPLSVNHQGQLPSVTISFNLKPGVSLSEAVSNIQTEAVKVLPEGVNLSFQGTAQVFQDSIKSAGILLILAIIVIYFILAVLYESFIHPLTILSGLPSAAIGALITLLIFGKELDLYGFVGVIMLIGIVKKNAIMMIDFARKYEKEHHKSPEEAILEGALVRFRPIMMTTISAFMGTLPIALGYGAGGEARQALGLSVTGGLVFSQIITLLITPVIYVMLEKLFTKKTPLNKA